MFDGLVLGVDPGTASIGLATVRGTKGRPTVCWASTLTSTPGLATAERLHRIYRGVSEAIRAERPDVVAIERLMWGRNTTSAMEVARASGVIMTAAAEAGVAVEEYGPLEVKMAITGVGNAAKQDVRRALARVFGAENVPVQVDAADAVAVAVCHLQQSSFRAVVRQARR